MEHHILENNCVTFSTDIFRVIMTFIVHIMMSGRSILNTLRQNVLISLLAAPNTGLNHIVENKAFI